VKPVLDQLPGVDFKKRYAARLPLFPDFYSILAHPGIFLNRSKRRINLILCQYLLDGGRGAVQWIACAFDLLMLE
jgi:hypothetical protein